MGSHTLSTRASPQHLEHMRYLNYTTSLCVIYTQIVIHVYEFQLIKLYVYIE